MRNPPEQIFYDAVKQLAENLFTKKNPNLEKYYYAQQGGFEMQKELEKLGEHFLEKLEDWKHLIIEEKA